MNGISDICAGVVDKSLQYLKHAIIVMVIVMASVFFQYFNQVIEKK